MSAQPVNKSVAFRLSRSAMVGLYAASGGIKNSRLLRFATRTVIVLGGAAGMAKFFPGEKKFNIPSKPDVAKALKTSTEKLPDKKWGIIAAIAVLFFGSWINSKVESAVTSGMRKVGIKRPYLALGVLAAGVAYLDQTVEAREDGQEHTSR